LTQNDLIQIDLVDTIRSSVQQAFKNRVAKIWFVHRPVYYRAFVNVLEDLVTERYSPEHMEEARVRTFYGVPVFEENGPIKEWMPEPGVWIEYNDGTRRQVIVDVS
jgi:hypothetical protein